MLSDALSHLILETGLRVSLIFYSHLLLQKMSFRVVKWLVQEHMDKKMFESIFEYCSSINSVIFPLN